MQTTPHSRPPTLDALAAERWQRSAPSVSPWLHEEVAKRMLDRLQWIKLPVKSWANWGAVRGGLAAHAQLLARYPKSECFVVETQANHAAAAIKSIAKSRWNPLQWTAPATHFARPPAAGVDLLWSNMALHEASDPQALLVEWHHLIRANGFAMFSCLGPDTAIELRGLYQALGWPPAGHQMTDMHDWGDMLVALGFAEPVLDMERITLTFETPERLLAELRQLGRNLHPQRFGGLRSRQWKARLEALLSERGQRSADGRLNLTFEVIYGHAVKPLPRMKVSTLSSVSVQDMRAMLQAPHAERKR